MLLNHTTPIPNEFFVYMPTLTHAELRVLLLVIRQTYGWIDHKTGNRKVKDKLSYSFIIQKTGLYRTILSTTIQQLIDKQLLVVTDLSGTELATAAARRGHQLLFYEPRLVRNSDMTCSQSQTRLVRDYEHNKRNTLNKNLQKKQQAHLEQFATLKQTLLATKHFPSSPSD